MSKITIGNGKIKMQGDFTGLLIIKKASNTDGFEYSNVKNAYVLGTGHNNPATLKDKLKTLWTIWKWIGEKGSSDGE